MTSRRFHSPLITWGILIILHSLKSMIFETKTKSGRTLILCISEHISDFRNINVEEHILVSRIQTTVEIQKKKISQTPKI